MNEKKEKEKKIKIKIVVNYIDLKDLVLLLVILLDWSLKFFDLFDCQLFLLIMDFVVVVVVVVVALDIVNDNEYYMKLVVDVVADNYIDDYYVNYEVKVMVMVDEIMLK
jgi:hypothetical protein